ncbi:MAG TPA: adenylate cyclase regulatory domain-containing protein [Acidimicrobiales bacterium]|nr:adenylate cyclase regulatory domain-containing protein [Acidimicrobiales bacterium]
MGPGPHGDPGPAGATDGEALTRVRAFLLAHGATEDEIARAQAEDVLDLLVADCLLVPTARRYSEAEVAQRTGMAPELLRRFWRALGFPDVDPGDRAFTDIDVEALVTLRGLFDVGVADVDTGLQLARVIGSSMARIAEAEMSPPVRGMVAGDDEGDTVQSADRFARLADTSIPAMAHLLEFVWRRHLQAALRRAMALRTRPGGGTRPVLAVGFADMVGFTTLSQQLDEEELAAVVSRFEELAHDTITAGGGRVVKMIGDEAMFVADDAVAAARIGLALADAYADDELLSDVRVALAVGPVLVQDGDYYGTVVNLASRVVNLALPGSVLVTEDVRGALLAGAVVADDDEGDGERGPDAGPGGAGTGTGAVRDGAEFALRALRPRLVKDLGRVPLWVLYRPGTEPVTPDRRSGRRWTLADLLHDLDDLRERGERLIAGSRRQREVAGAGSGPAGGDRSGPGEADGGDAEGPELE